MIKMTSKHITVVGSTHMDFTIYVKKLPRTGETIIGKEFKMTPGGKGANQAVAISRLEWKTYHVSKVGDDQIGRILIENLRRNKVETKYTYIDETVDTSTAFIIVDENGENMIVVNSSADQALTPEDIMNARSIIETSEILLTQLEIPIETVHIAITLAYEKGIPTILNPAPARKLPVELIKKITILTPNITELETLTGVNTKNEKHRIIQASRQLLEQGPEYVIVTLGKEGALIVDKDSATHISTIKVKPVDTTGAGDAFNGALAVALAEKQEITKAVRFANIVAALKVTMKGAQTGLPTRRKVIEFMKRQGIKI